MKLTADISLYPQREDFIPVIDDFIQALREVPELSIATTETSTLICGEYDSVFRAVQTGLRASTERYGMQVLVCKFFVGERDVGTWVS